VAAAVKPDPKGAVRSQFGRQAAWYSVSAVHRRSRGLDEVVRLAAASPADRALDIATGTGFTALAVAPHCRRIVALDLTLGMVAHARRLAEDRKTSNLSFCLGDAESLPFAGACFDLITCRHAAHHFPHLARALQEMARVLRPAGRLIFDDTCAPESAALAQTMNNWERRRDPSHVANQPPSRLRNLLEACGLAVEASIPAEVPLGFNDWVRRSGVPPGEAAALRAALLGAPPEARSAFRIELADGDVRFAWPEVVILAVKRDLQPR
jgi:ubiquinone/menaquinone biosynthesis C-methylase UbiE